MVETEQEGVDVSAVPRQSTVGDDEPKVIAMQEGSSEQQEESRAIKCIVNAQAVETWKSDEYPSSQHSSESNDVFEGHYGSRKFQDLGKDEQDDVVQILCKSARQIQILMVSGARRLFT